MVLQEAANISHPSREESGSIVVMGEKCKHNALSRWPLSRTCRVIAAASYSVPLYERVI